MKEFTMCVYVRVCFDASALADAFALDVAIVADAGVVLLLLFRVVYGGAFFNRGLPSKARSFSDSNSNGFL